MNRSAVGGSPQVEVQHDLLYGEKSLGPTVPFRPPRRGIPLLRRAGEPATCHQSQEGTAIREPQAETPDEGSEADRLEQQMPVKIDPDDVDESDATDKAVPLLVADSEASEGDLIEKSQPIPRDCDEDRG